MCGIAGYVGQGLEDAVLTRMVRALAHRGPDGEGFYRHGRVHMGMRRLSIIDVGGGHQPIYNADKTAVIVFNGEIYNYQEERARLEKQGRRFFTKSDTEVILALYEERGVECVHHLRGMFAFAIHDLKKNIVFIARDRMGVKPFYYCDVPGGMAFASEIKALLEHPEVRREPDLAGIDAYLTLRYSPGPESMFAGIRKLPAAHWMIWDNGKVEMKEYWRWEDWQNGERLTDADYQKKFNALFEESVRLRMISEVPLGAFLSGGVDSTAIVAAMAKNSARPVETFSVGFDWKGDELDDARQVANRLGCNHHEVICRRDDMAILPKLVHALDEPVGDPIIVPMHLLSKLARQHVTVALSGEGADEMLCGYFMHKTLLRANRIPKGAAPLLAEAVRMTPAALLDLVFDYPGKMGARSKERLVDFLRLLQKSDVPGLYLFLISLFDGKDKKDLYAPVMKRHDLDRFSTHGPTFMSRMLSLQKDHWLPDDILTKMDKMTMVNSLEGREPFMDHKLVEFLLGTPDHLKRSGGRNKVLLRNYVDGVLPGGIAKRPKKAFYVPLEKYLFESPLQDMVRMCLSPGSIKKRGLFKPEAVAAIMEKGRSGDFLYAKQIFSLLSLELWFRIYMDREAGWL